MWNSTARLMASRLNTSQATNFMPDENKPWIGVDLDGVLAAKEGDYMEGKIGWPIYKMVELVKYNLGMGNVVKIFTARADSEIDRQAIEKWLVEEAGLPVLEITNKKDHLCVMYLDDIAYHVKTNSGVADGLGSSESHKPVFKLTNRKPFSIQH